VSLCANHPEARGEHACAGCGRSFCGRCVVRLAGRFFCEPCKAGPVFADAMAGRLPPPPPPEGADAPRARRPFLAYGCAALLLTACIATAVLAPRAVRTATGKAQAAAGPSLEDACRRDLRRLRWGLDQYKKAHGAFPTRASGASVGDVIRHLSEEGHLRKREQPGIPIVACPGLLMRGYLPFPGLEGTAFALEDASFEGLGGTATLPYEGPVRPLVWDKDLENHGGRGRNVLFEDGTIRWFPAGATVTASGGVP
jgi:hypothetical protein